jgi:hypothetical protein
METMQLSAGIMGGLSQRQRAKIKLALLPRSPESLSTGELATFMQTWIRPARGRPSKWRKRSPRRPKVSKHEDDHDQNEPDPTTNDELA